MTPEVAQKALENRSLTIVDRVKSFRQPGMPLTPYAADEIVMSIVRISREHFPSDDEIRVAYAILLEIMTRVPLDLPDWE